MRAVAAVLAAIVLLGGPAPAGAAPPGDIAAYCRTIHPQVPFQVRCLNLENAAAARVGALRPSHDPENWARCQSSAPSWSAMEQCLAAPARAASTPPAGAGGAGSAPGGAGPVESAAPPAPGTPAGASTPPASTPAPVAAPPAPPAPAGNVPPSSTVILGPRPTPTPSSERERQTRAISEADADRQLRSVLERNPSARCEKKQYGPGWVITCE
jgi:hypothetical protein